MHGRDHVSPRVPLSYDEIARHTVPDPDGFVHPDPPPTEAELRLDKQMREAINDALIAHEIDTLGFEVIRGRVILRGWARDQATASRIEQIITEAAPEAEIDNRMRIGGSE
jgi:osmotically-inducible protein OsmY